MIPRPHRLSPDDEPIEDARKDAAFRKNAVRGSARLLRAILRAQRPVEMRRPRRTGQHTWPARMRRRAEVRRIQAIAAEHFGISVSDFTGPRGNAEMSERRQIAMFVAREETGASYPDLGACFKRDHTTVLHACRVMNGRPDLAPVVADLRERLGG